MVGKLSRIELAAFAIRARLGFEAPLSPTQTSGPQAPAHGTGDDHPTRSERVVQDALRAVRSVFRRPLQPSDMPDVATCLDQALVVDHYAVDLFTAAMSVSNEDADRNLVKAKKYEAAVRLMKSVISLPQNDFFEDLPWICEGLQEGFLYHNNTLTLEDVGELTDRQWARLGLLAEGSLLYHYLPRPPNFTTDREPHLDRIRELRVYYGQWLLRDSGLIFSAETEAEANLSLVRLRLLNPEDRTQWLRTLDRQKFIQVWAKVFETNEPGTQHRTEDLPNKTNLLKIAGIILNTASDDPFVTFLFQPEQIHQVLRTDETSLKEAKFDMNQFVLGVSGRLNDEKLGRCAEDYFRLFEQGNPSRPALPPMVCELARRVPDWLKAYFTPAEKEGIRLGVSWHLGFYCGLEHPLSEETKRIRKLSAALWPLVPQFSLDIWGADEGIHLDDSVMEALGWSSFDDLLRKGTDPEGGIHPKSIFQVFNRIAGMGKKFHEGCDKTLACLINADLSLLKNLIARWEALQMSGPSLKLPRRMDYALDVKDLLQSSFSLALKPGQYRFFDALVRACGPAKFDTRNTPLMGLLIRRVTPAPDPNADPRLAFSAAQERGHDQLTELGQRVQDLLDMHIPLSGPDFVLNPLSPKGSMK